MRFGVLQFFSWSRRGPLAAVYERAFSRMQIMDQTGYDCVWLAEHETIGLDYLMCAPLSHQSFTLFTEQVLPKLL